MKMRRHHYQQDEGVGIDLTPMLDVVFIMLIFFIVTSSFIRESGVEVRRPQADTASVKDSGNILVAVTAEGEVWIDRQVVDVRSVRAHIERLRMAQPEGAVLVQADREARTGLVVQVMDQARQAGVSDVALAADTGAD